MSRRTNTIVLTTHKPPDWISIREVLPAIHKSWKATKSKEHLVTFIDIDKTHLSKIIRKTLKADNVIFTCYTAGLFKLAGILRFKLNLPARFIVHVFNHATIAFWPMRYFGGENLFRKSDLFISTSQSDRRCVRLTFPEAKVAVIPFPGVSSWRDSNVNNYTRNGKYISFVYIGRISSQKLIHMLLFSFYLLKDAYPGLAWRLRIIGGPDHLGSPNMGIAESGYLSRLKVLAERLNIFDQIEFSGFLSQKLIRIILNKGKHILVSTSLHSDENFGLAVHQGLMNGHSAVLSDWGGHSDLKKNFPHQVFLCPVRETINGPTIYAAQFAKKLMLACKRLQDNYKKNEPTIYNPNSITISKTTLALSSFKQEQHLVATKIANVVLSRACKSIARKMKSKLKFKIFNGYHDPIAKRIFESYGMRHQLNPRPKTIPLIQPWIEFRKDKILVMDDHKGPQWTSRKPENKRNLIRVRTIDGVEVSLHKENFQWLYLRGYLESYTPALSDGINEI